MEHHHREGTRGQSWFILMASLSALIIGAGMLTRYWFGCLLLPVIGYFIVFFGQRRAVIGLSTIAVCGLMVAPWLVRNFNLSGTPFGTTGYADLPGDDPAVFRE